MRGKEEYRELRKGQGREVEREGKRKVRVAREVERREGEDCISFIVLVLMFLVHV